MPTGYAGGALCRPNGTVARRSGEVFWDSASRGPRLEALTEGREGFEVEESFLGERGSARRKILWLASLVYHLPKEFGLPLAQGPCPVRMMSKISSSSLSLSTPYQELMVSDLMVSDQPS